MESASRLIMCRERGCWRDHFGAFDFRVNRQFIPPVVVFGRLASMRGFVPSKLFLLKAWIGEMAKAGEQQRRGSCAETQNPHCLVAL